MTDHTLVAQQFAQDPRIAQAKKLLSTALQEHQQKINGVRPPIPALKESYDQLLHEFTHVRGSPLYFPYIGSGIGKGALVELLDGSVKYDFITGIGPHCLGHSSPELLSTNIDAALSDTVMQGNLQQNADALEFCQLLIKESGLEHCFLTTTGAMANENALKIAFQKNHPASRILAFERCFFGRTLVASQVTDKAAYRDGLPINTFVDYIPFYNPARHEESIQHSVEILKKHLKRYPNQHAAFVIEPIQGEGGFYEGNHEFFKALIEVIKDQNIAIFSDEIQTFGRTSRLFAFQHFGLEQYVDICCIGKLSQVCATLYNKEYCPRSGLLSQTFTGSASAIRSGKMIVQKLLNEGYFGPDGKNMHIHKVMTEHLEGIARRHPSLIEGPYGSGVMIACTPFGGHNIRVIEFVQKLFEAGVMTFVAGTDPTRMRMLAPFGVVTDDDITKAMRIIEDVLIGFEPSV